MAQKWFMWFGWTTLLLLAVFAAPRASSAQVSVYGEVTASDLNDGTTGVNFLYGGTGGVLVDGPTIFKRMVLSADVKGRYIDKSGERLVSLLVGPRIAYPIKKFGLSPYAEFAVGFARYRSGTTAGPANSTDNQWQVEGGLAKRLSPRFDVVADYGYSQFGVNNGEYNPKNISAGVIFHFVKR